MTLSLRGVITTKQSIFLDRFAFLAMTFVFLFLLFSSAPAFANEKFGMAMVGAPKYNVDNTHLDYANPNAPKGGTLKQSATGSFDTLNPYNIKGRAAAGVNLVTDKLMIRVWDEPFTLYPMIAKSVDAPDDRSSITFNLNPKARFHDGTPITTDDVLFSFETLREFGRPNMRRIYKMATPTVTNKQTIRFDLNEERDRETVMIMAMMPVLSRAYWQGKDFDKTTLEAPLGSGPYEIPSAPGGKKILVNVHCECSEAYVSKSLLHISYPTSPRFT